MSESQWMDRMTAGELMGLIWRRGGLNEAEARKLEINRGVCGCYRRYVLIKRWADGRIKWDDKEDER